MAFLDETGLAELWSLIKGDRAAKTDLTNHVNNKSNPHGVTAAQIGAPTGAEVSGQINTHNADTSAHNDIRVELAKKYSPTNKPTAADIGALNKTTYEYNAELALGAGGKVCIGKFPMYDSNVSVEIKSTTSQTYNGTLVIATQNINTSGGGVYQATVYGDASNTLTNSIKIHYGSGSNVFSVYIDLPGWSKNLLHIQCVSLASTPSSIATSVDSIPSNATIVPTNALKAQLDGKAASSHTHTKSQITDFPTSMPASDVYSWAKAASKPTYTASEVGAAETSHNHSASNITSGTLAVARGGTGKTSLSEVRSAMGLGVIGEYTGNGSSSSRTVSTGGHGHALMIWSAAYLLFVTPRGGICLQVEANRITEITFAMANFINGVLTIGTADATLNANGTVYAYQVL